MKGRKGRMEGWDKRGRDSQEVHEQKVKKDKKRFQGGGKNLPKGKTNGQKEEKGTGPRGQGKPPRDT